MELVANWGARPVFITSTFQDMQAERDWLWDFVFPAIEERLRSRRRWLWSGVVELAASHEAAYLDHCRKYAMESNASV